MNPLTEFVQSLPGHDRLKVWSFLVTLLGDLTLDSKASVSGVSITAISARMGIKPEAVRVALHRLRKDNWIETVKVGRESRHSLTTRGLRETQAVSPRVYTTGETASLPSVSLAVWTKPDAPATDQTPGIWLRDGALLTTNGDGLPGAPLIVNLGPEQPLPDWVLEAVLPSTLAAEYTELANRIKWFRESSEFGKLADLDAITLRLSVLHSWRRLVLRHGDEIDALKGPNWPGALCRHQVAWFLDRFPRPDPASIDVISAQT